MTSQSPRIYLYKITFEEVSYYYYGVHKEKKFNEYYMGSPYTHKWMWKHYTPKKQILELFDYTDEGWLKAQEVEKRLIKPFYNTDKWCLNEHCGGKISLDKLKEAGKIAVELKLGIHGWSREQFSENGKRAGKASGGGQRNKRNKTGICGLTQEQRSENGKKSGKIGGQKTYEMGVGVHGRTKEQMSEDGKKGGEIGGKIVGKYLKENKLGIFSISKEERSEINKKAGKLTYELGIGVHSLTKEQLIENGKKAAQTNEKNNTGLYGLTTEERRKNVKITNSQKWECCETGYVSTAAGVVKYQKGRGIDTSKTNRRRLA